jgi:hypothetical protein
MAANLSWQADTPRHPASIQDSSPCGSHHVEDA